MIQSTLQSLFEAVRMPENAQISALALLGAAGAFAVSFLAAAITAAAGQTKTAIGIAALAAAIVVTYGAVLLGLAVTSPDRVLAGGGRKYFCELDCHLATSVEGVETAKSVGPPSARLSTGGRFVVVRVRTWFDPSTIAPWRGNAALTPNPRTAWVVDASVYLPKIQAPVLGLYPSAGPITNPEQERLLTSNIANLRMVHLPATFHKVQLIFPAACANHLLHFAAQCDGISCREP